MLKILHQIQGVTGMTYLQEIPLAVINSGGHLQNEGSICIITVCLEELWQDAH